MKISNRIRMLTATLAAAALVGPVAHAGAVTPAQAEANGFKAIYGVTATDGPNAARPAAAEFPAWTMNWAERPQAAPEFPAWTVSWAEPKAPDSSPLFAPIGFDYGDAGIGAAIALGTALLLAVALLVTRRHRLAQHP